MLAKQRIVNTIVYENYKYVCFRGPITLTGIYEQEMGQEVEMCVSELIKNK